MAELLNISGGERPERELDLIFVHGLDGDGRGTWQHNNDPNYFWPGWLAKDYPNVGVWSLDYEVSATEWKEHGMPLNNRARNCLELFDLKQIGRRPIGFVCHSLGGLLVKQMLRLANEFKHPGWQAVAEQTRFIVFLSTPHSGADLANWLQHIGTLLRTSVSVKELEANNPQLLELNTWYRQNSEPLAIKTHVFFENLPTRGVLVVNETSADPGITGVHPIPLDADHITICKPDKKSGHVYERVEQLIKETLSAASAASESKTYPGDVKLAFRERLGASWTELADLLAIKPSEQARFSRGLEARAIWEWLEQRGRLSELPAALTRIERADLAEVLSRHPK